MLGWVLSVWMFVAFVLFLVGCFLNDLRPTSVLQCMIWVLVCLFLMPVVLIGYWRYAHRIIKEHKEQSP